MKIILDKDIRAALHASLVAAVAPGAVLIDEFGIGSGACVADVALFQPRSLDLYEIKSDADSMLRLRWQTEFYSLCGPSSCTLVAGHKLFEKAALKVPAWWGLMRAYDADGFGVKFVRERESGQNPEQDKEKIASVLWSDETWAELKLRGLSRGKSKLGRASWARLLCEALSTEELCEFVHRAISKREWFASRKHKVRICGERAA